MIKFSRTDGCYLAQTLLSTSESTLQENDWLHIAVTLIMFLLIKKKF